MKKRKIISAFLALSFTFSLLSLNVSAENSNDCTVDVVTYDYNTGKASTETIVVDNADMYSAPYTPNAEVSNAMSTYGILPGGSIKPVPDVTKSPYSKVVLLRIGFDTNNNGQIDQWSTGTGFMVKNKVLLTACHTIWHTTYKVNAKEFRVCPKYNSSAEPSSYYYPSQWTYPVEYTTAADNTKYDWCVVQMQSNVGQQTGYFGYRTASNYPSVAEKLLTVSGYPSSHKFYQYYDTGNLYSVSSGLVKYRISTEGGQSGGPVFDEDNFVWAIHTGSGVPNYNVGVEISSTIISVINQYNT